MKVIDLFRQLSFGELSNLAISDSGSGTIVEAKQPQLAQYANDALLKLYTRFILKEKTLLLEQVNHITNYHLDRKYAETSESDVDWPYIKDLPNEPFTGDVIRILGVYNDELGQYPLNDVGKNTSLFTPQPDLLQIPNPSGGVQIIITYQARHPVLDDRIDHILDQKIEIPFYLETALKKDIAASVFSHMNGQENILKSQEYLAAYEATCLDVETRDLANQTLHTTHSKLEQRGFA